MRTKKKNRYIYMDKNLFNSRYNINHINIKFINLDSKAYKNPTIES